MSVGVSVANICATPDFDVFSRASEIDFLSIYDEEECDKHVGNSQESPPLYKHFQHSVIYNAFDEAPDLGDWRSALGDCVTSSAYDHSEVDDDSAINDNVEDFEEEGDEKEEDLNLQSGVSTPFGQFQREPTLDDLFKTLEQVTCDESQFQEEPEEEGGRGAKSEWSEDLDSLFDFSDTGETEDVRFLEDDVLPLPQTPQIADLTMSYEARSAILQTLRDMTNSDIKNTANSNMKDNIRYKGVSVQKRIRENRSKYDNYRHIFETGPRGRGPLSSASTRGPSARCVKFLDSEGGTAHDGNSSELSYDSNSDKEEKHKMARLPSLSNKKGGFGRPISSGTNVFSLEEAKLHKYRLPGIGKFDIMLEEKEFEITPPGFDSRYNARPTISEEEKEDPPHHIKSRSVNKCKRWLKNVNIHPLSLHPVQK